MKKLRIATMVSGQFTTPPPYGVIYAPMDVAVDVALGLSERGHEVTYFGPVGTAIPGLRVETEGLEPLKRQDGHHRILDLEGVRGGESGKIHALWDEFLIAQMFARAKRGEFDILHVHPADRALALASACVDVPTVYTLHDPIFAWRAEMFRLFSTKNQHFVSISEAQRKPAPELNYLATVYNGMITQGMPYSDKPGDYLLFVGRLIPEKGVAEAVEVALATGDKLVIAGPPTESAYWKEKIEPRVDGKQITFVGMQQKRELRQLYAGAKATLFPARWEEPFGLVMTESMVTGTPVIGFRRGSVPEIVAHGKTGFVVDTVEEMADAVARIGEINRADCRARVEERFSVKAMVDGYEEAFLRIAS